MHKSPESLVHTAEGGAWDFTFHTSSLLLDQKVKEGTVYTSGTGGLNNVLGTHGKAIR